MRTAHRVAETMKESSPNHRNCLVSAQALGYLPFAKHNVMATVMLAAIKMLPTTGGLDQRPTRGVSIGGQREIVSRNDEERRSVLHDSGNNSQNTVSKSSPNLPRFVLFRHPCLNAPGVVISQKNNVSERAPYGRRHAFHAGVSFGAGVKGANQPRGKPDFVLFVGAPVVGIAPVEHPNRKLGVVSWLSCHHDGATIRGAAGCCQAFSTPSNSYPNGAKWAAKWARARA